MNTPDRSHCRLLLPPIRLGRCRRPGHCWPRRGGVAGGLVAGLAVAVAVAVTIAPTAWAQTNAFESPEIDYMNAPSNDPAARLAERLEEGKEQLQYDRQHGYLRGVLEALDIPISSQVLVFSKTSLQTTRISPRFPRAIYFNDDVYVGWCLRGDLLEIGATDPQLGAVFYSLDQEESAQPVLQRDRGQCLSCHAGSRTQGAPGYLVRSVQVNSIGHPQVSLGSFVTDHASPFSERWGGWYVTGSHGEMRHMGNVVLDKSKELDTEAGANVLDLSEHFRVTPYLTPHSDLVALMVLEHQTQMHNAIAAANHETRLALAQSYQMNGLLGRPDGFISEIAQRRIQRAAQNVFDHLVMKGDIALTDPISGTSTFSEEFPQRPGPVDSQNRSLRQLNLQTRLFQYPCSFLIYSDAFAGLPDQVRAAALQLLAEHLQPTEAASGEAAAAGQSTGERDATGLEHWNDELRQDVREILIETLPEFASLVAAG